MSKKALGAERVLTVSMPCNSASTDFEDAKKCAEKFGVRFLEVDLSSSFETLKNEIDKSLEKNSLSNEALINVKPRLRMTTLYSIAQSFGYLVIGTGNLCESMVRIYN